MKQARRWVATVAALLMVASLVLAPGNGSAGEARGQYLPADPQPAPEVGPPETPPSPVPLVLTPAWLLRIFLAPGLYLDLVIVTASGEDPQMLGAQSTRHAWR